MNRSVGERGEGAARSALFVDGHVHVYPHVPLAAVFAAVARNVRALDGGGSPERPAPVVLVLADPSGVDGFGRLAGVARKRRGAEDLPGWTVASRDEGHAEFRADSGLRVVFLRGRQLVTEEGLEVLAAGTDASVTDGQSLSATLAEVRARNGWSTIAWGAGKWLGRRGRLVTDIVREQAGNRDVMLGDNGGRPPCWSWVPQFDAAAAAGMRVLPGSDPLPVQGDEARIGSYGFDIDVDMDVAGGAGESIGRAVKDALFDSSVEIRLRGARVGMSRFLLNQSRLKTSRAPNPR